MTLVGEMPNFEAVILAAGMGTRLGRPHPKPLTKLDSGETIMRRQIINVRGAFSDELSKTVVGGLGEAVDINYIAAHDKPAFIGRLIECDDQDYFERGIELAIDKDGVKVKPIDISQYPAIEVDFDADLVRANDLLK